MKTCCFSIPARVRLNGHLVPVVVRADWIAHDPQVLEPGDALGELEVRAVVTVAHRDVQDELTDEQMDSLCDLAQTVIEGGSLAPDSPRRTPSAPDVLLRAGLITELPVREEGGRVVVEVGEILRLNGLLDSPANRARMRAVAAEAAAANFPDRELLVR